MAVFRFPRPFSPGRDMDASVHPKTEAFIQHFPDDSDASDASAIGRIPNGRFHGREHCWAKKVLHKKSNVTLGRSHTLREKQRHHPCPCKAPQSAEADPVLRSWERVHRSTVAKLFFELQTEAPLLKNCHPIRSRALREESRSTLVS